MLFRSQEAYTGQIKFNHNSKPQLNGRREKRASIKKGSAMSCATVMSIISHWRLVTGSRRRLQPPACRASIPELNLPCQGGQNRIPNRHHPTTLQQKDGISRCVFVFIVRPHARLPYFQDMNSMLSFRLIQLLRTPNLPSQSGTTAFVVSYLHVFVLHT